MRASKHPMIPPVGVEAEFKRLKQLITAQTLTGHPTPNEICELMFGPPGLGNLSGLGERRLDRESAEKVRNYIGTYDEIMAQFVKPLGEF